MNHDECSFFHSFHRTDHPSRQCQQTQATTLVMVRFGHTLLIPPHRPPRFSTPAYIVLPSLHPRPRHKRHLNPHSTHHPLHCHHHNYAMDQRQCQEPLTTSRWVRQWPGDFNNTEMDSMTARWVRQQPDRFNDGQTGLTEPNDEALGHQMHHRAERRGVECRTHDEGKEGI